jgi:hypothetical protein
MSPDKLLIDLFQAYYDARKNKRSTINALSFEMDYEAKVFELYEEIKSGEYKISPSICFISFKPVQREIFAADFRDRVIHHLIYNYISPIFERFFIADSYSCRLGKGTSYGIRRLNRFIRSCSRNYTRDCYVLKLDISGYFMSIDHSVLYREIKSVLDRKRGETDFDVDLILGLIRQIVFHDHTAECRLKGKSADWNGLPRSKSLFCSGKGKGLPIGNLTSQLFGNVYLNRFDRFVKCELGCRYYGRYVDDIVIVHQDKEYLKSIIPILKQYLRSRLFLELHPKKIRLQHFSLGVPFLGAVIKPYRIYSGNQIKGGFYKRIRYWNNFLAKKGRLNTRDLDCFLAATNSYLGMLKQFNTYNLRKKILAGLSKDFEKYVFIELDCGKLVSRNQNLISGESYNL